MNASTFTLKKPLRNLWLFYAVFYLAIIMLMIFFSVIVSKKTYETMRQEAENRNIMVLSNVCNTIDQKLYELDILADSIAADSGVISFAQTTGSDTHIAGSARLLWDRIQSSYLQNRDMINSTTLYFSANDVLLQNNDIFLTSSAFFASQFGNASPESISRLSMALNSRSGKYALDPISANGIEFIPYIKQTHVTFSTNQLKVLYLIEKSRIDSLFKPLNIVEGCVYIADQYDHIFYVSGPNVELAQDFLLTVSAPISCQSINGRDMIVCKTASPYSKWKYVSIIPSEAVFSLADSIRSFTYCILSIMLVIGIIAASFFARYNAIPWARLLHTLDKKNNVTLPTPISNAIITTAAENASLRNRMQQKIEQQMRILERTTITHMLSGGYCEYQSEDWPLPASILQAQCYQVILLRGINDGKPVQGSWNLISVIQNSESYYCVQINAIDAVIIVSSTDANSCKHQTDLLIDHITGDICPELSLTLQIFVGSAHSAVEEIVMSYEEAVQTRTVVSATSQGVYYYRAEHSANGMYSYSIETERKLMQATINGNESICTSILEEIYNANFVQLNLNNWNKHQLVVELTGTYYKIKQLIDSSFEPAELPFDCNSDEETFFKQYHEALVICCHESIERHERHVDEMYQNIIIYMEQQYQNPLLSLTMISQHFGMGESTFSRFFKNATGDTFTVYLENLRMQKALSLMKQTNNTIGRISEMVGYNSIQSFGRAFKRCYGVSPDAWRKMQIE